MTELGEAFIQEFRDSDSGVGWFKFEFRNQDGRKCSIWGQGINKHLAKDHAQDILAQAGVYHTELKAVKTSSDLPTPVTESGW